MFSLVFVRPCLDENSVFFQVLEGTVLIDRETFSKTFAQRLLRKYHDTGILKERLLLNHLIVLHNVFGTTACVTLLLYKIQKEYWSVLKSFLIFINSITEEELSEIEENKDVLDVLRKI